MAARNQANIGLQPSRWLHRPCPRAERRVRGWDLQFHRSQRRARDHQGGSRASINNLENIDLTNNSYSVDLYLWLRWKDP